MKRVIILDILEEYDNGNIPKNEEIFKSFLVTNKKIQDYNNIVVSVSGGSDSDVMIDLFERVAPKTVKYVFFNTGLEYTATKEHLKYLKEKYDIEIEVINAKKPIPITCRDYGQPFLSKQVSEYIQRLQAHNFKWEDKPYSELIEEYPNCQIALKWWCNERGENSSFNINRNKYLKEFMIKHPPTFKISNKCCHYAKKQPVKKYLKDNKADLDCCGIRKSEGGARATAYKNCFSDNRDKEEIDKYRPIFWYKDNTKRVYEDFFGVIHSRCYTEYGLKRTGCAGCPYNKKFEEELKTIETYEPKLFKAVNNIFKDSYNYTREYRKFVNEKCNTENNEEIDGQMSIEDFDL